MNHPSPCRLTASDHALLEAMLERSAEPEGAHALLLRRKLAGAIVSPGSDLPSGVVRPGSRVAYRAGRGAVETCIVAREPGREAGAIPVLPLTTLRGLALLGLSEGESLALAEADGDVTLTVVSVAPASGTEESPQRPAARPALRLVHSAAPQPDEQPEAPQPVRYMHRPHDGDDDPGPSAA